MGQSNEANEWVFVPVGDEVRKIEPIRITGSRKEAKDKVQRLFRGKRFFQYTAQEWDNMTVPH